MSLRSRVYSWDIARDVDGLLMSLKWLLSNMLVKIRDNESLYELYKQIKKQWESFIKEENSRILKLNLVFKLLMSNPRELLHSLVLPTMLRFFDWAAQTASIPDQVKDGRAIVTPERCYYFLNEDTKTFHHSTDMRQKIFEALKLLQRLQMVLFKKKPVSNDRRDSESESSKGLEFTQSIPKKHIFQLNGLEDLEQNCASESFSVSRQNKSADYGKAERNNERNKQGANKNSASTRPLCDVTNVAFNRQKKRQIYPSPICPTFCKSKDQCLGPRKKKEAEFSSFLARQQYETGDHGSTPTPVFRDAISDFNQKLHQLMIENSSLRQQDSMLMQQINSLKKSLASLQKSVATLSNPTREYLPNNKVRKNRCSSSMTPMKVSRLSETASSNIASMGTQLGYSDSSILQITTEDLTNSYTNCCDTSLIKNHCSHINNPTESQTTPELQTGPLLGMQLEEPNPTLDIHAIPHPSCSLPILTIPSALHSSHPPKLFRPRYKDIQGAKISKGAQYQPPSTPDGKHYLLDEDGNFSIVMSNDQDSIYSIYNEFYQSLKPQVESYVQHHGKSSIIQFHKKRTFQKKKAFVYLVEKISFFTKLSPEYVLCIIDDIRQKEEKSIVWVCNNLGALKYALVRYHPDLKSIISAKD